MIRAFSIRRCGVLLAAIVLFSAVATAEPAEEAPVFDPLERPAKQLKDATQSAQLAIDNSGSRLVSVGEKGLILMSDDNGRSWRQVNRVPVSVTLTDVHFIDEQIGFAVGHRGVLLTTSDGGENWKLKLDGEGIAKLYMTQAKAMRESPGKDSALKEAGYLVQEGSDKPLLHVNFSDKRNGIIVGAYGLALRTNDGGEEWVPFASEVANKEGRHLYGSSFGGERKYLIGEQGSVFMREPNARPFKQVSSPYNGSYFGAITTKAGDVLLYGLRGNLWSYLPKTGDWSQVDYPYGNSITSAFKVEGGEKIFLGDASGNLVELSLESSRKTSLLENVGTYISDLIFVDGALVVSTVRGNLRIEAEL